ncbi:MAG: hypothetical protein ACPG31_11315 [Planctomycetota bacterium]
MSRGTSKRSLKSIEFVLWGAVILAGGYVLLPAAVELVQTRQQEETEVQQALDMEQDLRDAQDQLEFFGKDPDAARKKHELEGLRARNQDLEEAVKLDTDE